MLRIALALCLLASPAAAATAPPPAPTAADRAAAVDLLKRLVAIPTAKGRGRVPELVDLIAARLTEAGFTADDIVRRPVTIDGEQTMGLIVRYAGRDASLQPVALLAHMDVVDAVAANWATDPYRPVEKDGYLYGRGTQDNKFGVAVLVETFARLRRAGWRPRRDLLLAFSGDEETGMRSTRAVIAHPWVARAAYALNADAGGGSVTADGRPIAFGMQSAEKTNATFAVTVKNRGGHSSVPRADNAIYELARAVTRIEAMRFPVALNSVTRGMVARTAAERGGALGAALTKLTTVPDDAAAFAVIRRHPDVSTMLWSTCVATMLSAGNAPNALAQDATATVNCRILPGVAVESVRRQIADAAGAGAAVTLVGEAVESPVSEPRAEVTALLQAGLSATYPGAILQPVMSSGGTEGREYRRAGIPTWGAGSLGLVLPEDNRAHGTDERVPLRAFGKELDYWYEVLRRLG
ncbi:M20/M25/M40 family metallo-hydrolase [Sphingomonas sp. BK235]|uniref:M20/M25/M40 family metallo-hydrolase n=1 Tax=Sphingomonas sp. BK235 TaxID=2512131 RepID=UPI001051912C|nr:M20/M25/M40 family metallo-hydrolase [Sphingomonas sp. BK235]TCP35102.1 acetylornithine deacetylase/succinyl-diaminopimelate desuccinylase-like protein [Sphingomonas sp. BK235]